VTLPGTLLCLGTQTDNTFNLKKVPADKLVYFSSLTRNFLACQGRDWWNGPWQEP